MDASSGLGRASEGDDREREAEAAPVARQQGGREQSPRCGNSGTRRAAASSTTAAASNSRVARRAGKEEQGAAPGSRAHERARTREAQPRRGAGRAREQSFVRSREVAFDGLRQQIEGGKGGIGEEAHPGARGVVEEATWSRGGPEERRSDAAAMNGVRSRGRRRLDPVDVGAPSSNASP